MFLSGFHSTTNTTDLTKFSTGVYINPNNGNGQTLALFARNSQAQARFARIYERVQTWASTANSSTLARESGDFDLDGADEYLLYNSRLFGVFESKGGRMTAAWMRNPATGKIWQVAGNFAAYANTDTEDEGSDNATAYRTSGFKDWWLMPTSGSGNRASVNGDYTVAASGAAGWSFSNQSDVTKVVSLPSADATAFTASYTLSGLSKAYIRFGLSPNLNDLLVSGQANLGNEQLSNNNRRVDLSNTVSSTETVRAFVEVSSGGVILPGATDLASAGTTTLRRNQAQTHQVEVELSGNGPHLITLGFDDGVSKTDGIPDTWWSQHGINGPDRTASADFDGDGLSNLHEYVLGTLPNNVASVWRPLITTGGSGFQINFSTITGRTYTVRSRDNLTGGSWSDLQTVPGDGSDKTVTDTGSGSVNTRFYKVDVSMP